MKFIADSMLGRLVRWLRILGYDTLYYADIDDSLLLRIAREEGRTLLTRDTRLIKIRGLKNFIFIHNDRPYDQLKQLFKAGVISTGDESPLGDSETKLLSRCVYCNAILYTIHPDEAEGMVPDFVLWKSEMVRKCPNCNRTYWKGTHPERIKERLREVKHR